MRCSGKIGNASNCLNIFERVRVILLKSVRVQKKCTFFRNNVPLRGITTCRKWGRCKFCLSRNRWIV